MPVINFAKAKGAYLGTKKGNKAYIGDELVWEGSQVKIYTSHLTQETKAGDNRFVFARHDQKVLNIGDIVKVVIGGVTIPPEKIKTIDNRESHTIYLTFGYDKTFYIFEPVEVYLK